MTCRPQGNVSTMFKNRTQRGALLAETTASTAIICALVIALIYFVVEASFGLIIMNGLNQAAREGAREMAMLYLKSGGYQTPDSGSINGVLEKIAVGGVVNNASQFTVTWPTVYTRNSHPPLMVTVTCNAAPGQSGPGASNLSFPWGTLSFWSSKFSLIGLNMQASATYPLRP